MRKKLKLPQLERQKGNSKSKWLKKTVISSGKFCSRDWTWLRHVWLLTLYGSSYGRGVVRNGFLDGRMRGCLWCVPMCMCWENAYTQRDKIICTQTHAHIQGTNAHKHIQTHIYTYTGTQAHTQTNAYYFLPKVCNSNNCKYMCKCLCMPVWMYTCISKYAFVYVYVSIFMYVCVSMYLHVCLCVCEYMSICVFVRMCLCTWVYAWLTQITAKANVFETTKAAKKYNAIVITENVKTERDEHSIFLSLFHFFLCIWPLLFS